MADWNSRTVWPRLERGGQGHLPWGDDAGVRRKKGRKRSLKKSPVSRGPGWGERVEEAEGTTRTIWEEEAWKI